MKIPDFTFFLWTIAELELIDKSFIYGLVSLKNIWKRKSLYPYLNGLI